MKTHLVLSIFLIVVGIMVLGYQGFDYSIREKIVDLGPLDISISKTKTLPIPPIVGGIFIMSGIVLLPIGRKKDKTDHLDRL